MKMIFGVYLTYYVYFNNNYFSNMNSMIFTSKLDKCNTKLTSIIFEQRIYENNKD